MLSECNFLLFFVYELLYMLMFEIDDDDLCVCGLYCAYVVAASRWIVVSWFDLYGEFFMFEVELFVDEVDCFVIGL